MVKIIVESFSDDDLEKRWRALENKDNWEKYCEMCEMPGMLHKGPCTRKEEVNAFEYGKIYEAWKVFRKRMKPIIMLKEKQEEKTKTQNDLLVGLEKFANTLTTSQHKLIEANAANQQKLIEAIQ